MFNLEVTSYVYRTFIALFQNFNIKSAFKLKLWTLHSKDCTAQHDVKFKNWMLFLCVSSRYKGLYMY